jgi:carotenoid biosynthesis protein
MTTQEVSKTEDRGTLSPAPIVIGILLLGYLALVAGFAWNPTPLAQALAATGIVLAIVHATQFYGTRDALAIFAICITITFAVENLGSLTGFPFGHYHFEVGANLPHVGLIPVIVGPLWFGMGYFSWVLAGTLLGARPRPAGKCELLAWPVVAAFVMTQWDVVTDPPLSTISKAWIWHDGGAHFGVPLSNYGGWLLTSWLFYQAFAIYLGRRPGLPVPPPARARVLRLIAIALYLGSGFTHLTPWLLGQSGEVVDAAGHLWRIADIRATTVLTMLLTMFFTSLLAVLRLAAGDTTRQQD